jgi:hypothetical protein
MLLGAFFGGSDSWRGDEPQEFASCPNGSTASTATRVFRGTFLCFTFPSEFMLSLLAVTCNGIVDIRLLDYDVYLSGGYFYHQIDF